MHLFGEIEFMKKNTKTVKVTFLGGVGEVGKNMTAIECGDDMIIVDCGVSFATSEEAPASMQSSPTSLM